MSKTIVIDRAVVEQALEAFSGLLTYNTSNAEYAAGRLAVKSLQSALKQDQVEQPPRQPLTDDEINTIWRNSTHMTIVEVVRAIEAAHGIGEQQ